MRLDDQVTSLELSKRLKELGAPQESLYSWVYYEAMAADRRLGLDSDWSIRKGSPSEFYEACAAFTVAEMGEMLPECFQTERRQSGEWECSQTFTSITEGTKHLHKEYPDVPVAMFAPTEADARAKMLIYLIEQDLVTPGKEPVAE